MSTGNTKLMREMNIRSLRKIMKQQRVFTKAALAHASGLSVVTIHSLLEELMNGGEVIATDRQAATGGRKASLFEYNANHQLILTVCLFEKNGQEIARVAVCNLLGELIFENETVFAEMDLKGLEEQIEPCLEKFTNISLLTVGIPGFEMNGVLTIDFSKLHNKDLRNYLEKKYNIPVLIENDINAAISGYLLERELENDKCVVGIYYPTQNPPGVGVVLNGSLLKGRNGLVGEVNHIPLGIDWGSFSFVKSELEEHALKIVLTIVTLYDPDKFVLYGEIFTEELIQKIQKELMAVFPHINMPNMVVEDNFHRDYLNGVVAVSFKYLEPEFNIN